MLILEVLGVNLEQLRLLTRSAANWCATSGSDSRRGPRWPLRMPQGLPEPPETLPPVRLRHSAEYRRVSHQAARPPQTSVAFDSTTAPGKQPVPVVPEGRLSGRHFSRVTGRSWAYFVEKLGDRIVRSAAGLTIGAPDESGRAAFLLFFLFFGLLLPLETA